MFKTLSNQTVLTLLQFIGLSLPAVGIYMQMVYGKLNWQRLSEEEREVESGVYSMGRLAVLSLLVAGLLLLTHIALGDFFPAELIFLVDSLSLLAIVSGLTLFAGVVAFERTSRVTKPGILWGYQEFINHLAGHFTSRTERVFEPSYKREGRKDQKGR